MDINEDLINKILSKLNNDINVLLNEDFYTAYGPHKQLEILNQAKTYMAQIIILRHLNLLIKNDPTTIEEYELEDFIKNNYDKVEYSINDVKVPISTLEKIVRETCIKSIAEIHEKDKIEWNHVHTRVL